jgi:hypothetical protein
VPGAAERVKTEHIFISPDRKHSHRRGHAALPCPAGTAHAALPCLRCPALPCPALPTARLPQVRGALVKDITAWLAAQGCTPDILHIWTDGCSGQFR